MGRALSVLGLLIIIVICVGFYRGWFALHSERVDPSRNRMNVELTVDGEKMKSDVESARQSTVEFTEGTRSATQPVTPTPAPR